MLRLGNARGALLDLSIIKSDLGARAALPILSTTTPYRNAYPVLPTNSSIPLLLPARTVRLLSKSIITKPSSAKAVMPLLATFSIRAP